MDANFGGFSEGHFPKEGPKTWKATQKLENTPKTYCFEIEGEGKNPH